MMRKNTIVFSFINYRAYLTQALPTSGVHRGQRSLLAKKLRCQTAFVSRVLHGLANFSLEHAVLINHFLQHTDEESDFFLLLVHLGRAGSKDLEAHYKKKIREILERREQIRERIQVRTELSKEDQMTYYSAWYYSAIHVLLLIPSMRTRPAISNALALPGALVSRALEFLCSAGLARESAPGEFHTGETRIHLGQTSPMISKHHTNWRMRAIQIFERESREDLFYSGPICLSEKDVARVREALLKTLAEVEDIVRPSPEEAAFCLSMDFFRL